MYAIRSYYELSNQLLYMPAAQETRPPRALPLTVRPTLRNVNIASNTAALSAMGICVPSKILSIEMGSFCLPTLSTVLAMKGISRRQSSHAKSSRPSSLKPLSNAFVAPKIV